MIITFRNIDIRRLFLGALAIICILFAASCSALSVKVLEFGDVQNFSVSEIRRNGTLSLRISGLTSHSSLAVNHIESTRDKDTLTIKVFLVLARKGLSGRFDYTCEVPQGVQRVLFGEDGYQIWRGKGDPAQH
jgi:hypothetical protein